MQVYKIGIPEIAIGPLSSKLKSSLYLGPTLWLVSGGSNIKLAVGVMESLDSELSSNLTIALTDERYGPYNHQDSNWTQLLLAGFDPKKAQLIEALLPSNLDLQTTTQLYNDKLNAAFEDATDIIGQFGMGTDGHIAGILPNTVATNETDKLVIGYSGQPYDRITIGFGGINRLSAAFLMAFGSDKHDQLDKLINQQLSLAIQPAQIIKQLNESYLYNDQIEVIQ